MKTITKRNIIILVSVIVLILIVNYINNWIKVELAKKDLEISTLMNRVETEQKKLSPIEELSIRVWENHLIAEKHLLNIENLRQEFWRS